MEAEHCDHWPGCFVQTLADSRTAYMSWCSRISSAAVRVKHEFDKERSGRQILTSNFFLVLTLTELIFTEISRRLRIDPFQEM